METEDKSLSPPFRQIQPASFKMSNLSKLSAKRSERVIPLAKIIRAKSREKSRLKISKKH